MGKIEEAKIIVKKKTGIKDPKGKIKPSDGTKRVKIDGGSLD